MSENIQITSLSMPEFDGIVPMEIYKSATVSLGILFNGIPSGAICLYYSDRSYTCTWFYVIEACRRNGLGTELLTKALELLRTIEEVYPVEITFGSDDQNLYGFFEAYEHFSVRKIGKTYIIDSTTRHKSSYYSKMLKVSNSDCTSFFQYGKADQDYFINGLRLKNPELAGYIEKNMSLFDENLSLAYGNRIRAVSFAKVDDNQVEIEVFHAEDIAASGMLLVAGIKKLEEAYPDHDIKISCFNDKTEQFVRKFFDTEEETQIYTAAWDMRLPGEHPAFE